MINWLDYIKESNLAAAHSYLELAVGHGDADVLIERLKIATLEQFAAKDILRAANIPALPITVEHVLANIKKMKHKEEIGPVLLCRVNNLPLIIADGMHRVSAAYHLEEDTVVHAFLAELKDK